MYSVVWQVEKGAAADDDLTGQKKTDQIEDINFLKNKKFKN